MLATPTPYLRKKKKKWTLELHNQEENNYFRDLHTHTHTLRSNFWVRLTNYTGWTTTWKWARMSRTGEQETGRKLLKFWVCLTTASAWPLHPSQSPGASILRSSLMAAGPAESLQSTPSSTPPTQVQQITTKGATSSAPSSQRQLPGIDSKLWVSGDQTLFLNSRLSQTRAWSFLLPQ